MVRLKCSTVALAALLAFTGCSPATSSPSVSTMPTAAPSVAPTYSCTPTFGGVAYECEKSEYDKLATAAEEYKAATELYQTVNRRIETLAAQRKPFDAGLKAMMADPYLSQAAETQQLFINGTLTAQGHTKLAWSRPLDQKRYGSDLAIKVCDLAGSLVVRGSGGQKLSDSPMEHNVFLVRDGETLRMAGDDTEEVSTC